MSQGWGSWASRRRRLQPQKKGRDIIVFVFGQDNIWTLGNPRQQLSRSCRLELSSLKIIVFNEAFQNVLDSIPLSTEACWHILDMSLQESVELPDLRFGVMLRLQHLSNLCRKNAKCVVCCLLRLRCANCLESKFRILGERNWKMRIRVLHVKSLEH